VSNLVDVIYNNLQGIDSAAVIALTPRVLHAVLASVGEHCFYRLLCRWNAIPTTALAASPVSAPQQLQPTFPVTALILYSCSWSTLFMGCRSLGNNVETSCLLLYLWLLDPDVDAIRTQRSGPPRGAARRISLSMVLGWVVLALSVYVRPTAALLLAPLWLWQVAYPSAASVPTFVGVSALTVTATWVLFAAFDHCMYGLLHCAVPLVDMLSASGEEALGRLFTASALCDPGPVMEQFGQSLVPVNFLYFNVMLGYASTFGVKPVYWYFVEGLPVMLGLYLPLGLGIWVLHTAVYLQCQDRARHIRFTLPNAGATLRWICCSPQRVLVATTLANLVLMSLLSPHKEYRFLLPLMPGLILPLAQAVQWLSQHFPMTIHAIPVVAPTSQSGLGGLPLVVRVIIAVHVVFAGYMLQGHQGGAELASQRVATIAAEEDVDHYSSGRRVFRVDQLAPCYSFPGYAHSHSRSSVAAPIIALSMPICHAPKPSLRREAGFPELTSALFVEQPASFLAQHISQQPLPPPNFTQAELELRLEAGFATVSADLILTFDCYFSQSRHPALSPVEDGSGSSEGSGGESSNGIELWPVRRQAQLGDEEMVIWAALTAYYNTHYVVEETWHHVHFQHDLDDPELKQRVVLLRRKRVG
jgi:hypothetical protein